jgi:hypothetical protein
MSDQARNCSSSSSGAIWLPSEALANGIRILGAAGSGKSQLGAWLLLFFFLQRRPFLVFDPTRSLINSFLTLLADYIVRNRLSDRQQAELYDRITYCDLGGQSGYVTPFSLFQRYGNESLSSVADRVMSWVSGNFAASHSASIEGFNSINQTLYPASIIAAALQPDIQVTEVLDLIHHPKSNLWKQRFEQVLTAYPAQAAEAVAYFQGEFSKLQSNNRARRLNMLEVVLQPFRFHLPMRAAFGARSPGLDYNQVIEQGKMVLFDASGLDGEYKQQVLNWILLYSFPPYLKSLGSGHKKITGVMIDEISIFYQDSPESMKVFANRFGELVHVLRRQYGIHPLTVMHQSVAQLDEDVAAHLAALGNQIIGKPADYESALMLAEQLFPHQTYVKRYEPIYGNIPNAGPQIIDVRAIEYSRQEVLHQQALNMLRLKKLHFLTRLTTTEGGGQGPLQTINITSLLGPWPDLPKLDAMCRQLAARSGVAIQDVLTDIAARNASQNQQKQAPAEDQEDEQYDDSGYKREG